MPGFMGSTSAMTVCVVDEPRTLDLEKLRARAFSNAIDPNGFRQGWVGMTDMLDTHDFFLALSDGRFSGFSFRRDSRGLSSALVKLHVEERLRKEEDEGRKTGGRRKKEIREDVINSLLARAEFVPAVTDCIWDNEKGRLFIASSSLKVVDTVISYFNDTFGFEPNPLAAEVDMAAIFSVIQSGDGLWADKFHLEAAGSAKLVSSPGSGDKVTVDAQNSPDAVIQALDRGLNINRIKLVAEKKDEDVRLEFGLDINLSVSGLRFPKAEKGSDQDATFLINSEVCSEVADIVENISRNKD